MDCWAGVAMFEAAVCLTVPRVTVQSELVSGKVQQLHLTVSGDLVGKASELIMSSMLKGFLGKRVADVNLINALHTAEEQGIKLVTSVVSSTEAQNKVLVEVSCFGSTRDCAPGLTVCAAP